MLVLAVILAPAFAGSKTEPVAHVGDLAHPATVEFRLAFTPAEALDDVFDLQELGFGILCVIGAGECAFSAGAQIGLKVADVGVQAGLRFQ